MRPATPPAERRHGSASDPVPFKIRELLDSHSAYVSRTIRHFGVPASEVPDLRQEVFFTIHRKFADFEGRSSIRTWLYGICLRVVAAHRRRAYVRRERPTADPAIEEAGWTGEEPDSQVEQRFAMRDLLEQLDPEKREVVLLYEVQGFSMKQVAEMVGCPLHTAYSRLQAGRERLLAAVVRQR